MLQSCLVSQSVIWNVECSYRKVCTGYGMRKCEVECVCGVVVAKNAEYRVSARTLCLFFFSLFLPTAILPRLNFRFGLETFFHKEKKNYNTPTLKLCFGFEVFSQINVIESVICILFCHHSFVDLQWILVIFIDFAVYKKKYFYVSLILHICVRSDCEWVAFHLSVLVMRMTIQSCAVKACLAHIECRFAHSPLQRLCVMW